MEPEAASAGPWHGFECSSWVKRVSAFVLGWDEIYTLLLFKKVAPSLLCFCLFVRMGDFYCTF